MTDPTRSSEPRRLTGEELADNLALVPVGVFEALDRHIRWLEEEIEGHRYYQSGGHRGEPTRITLWKQMRAERDAAIRELDFVKDESAELQRIATNAAKAEIEARSQGWTRALRKK